MHRGYDPQSAVCVRVCVWERKATITHIWPRLVVRLSSYPSPASHLSTDRGLSTCVSSSLTPDWCSRINMTYAKIASEKIWCVYVYNITRRTPGQYLRLGPIPDVLVFTPTCGIHAKRFNNDFVPYTRPSTVIVCNAYKINNNVTSSLWRLDFFFVFRTVCGMSWFFERILMLYCYGKQYGEMSIYNFIIADERWEFFRDLLRTNLKFPIRLLQSLGLHYGAGLWRFPTEGSPAAMHDCHSMIVTQSRRRHFRVFKVYLVLKQYIYI